MGNTTSSSLSSCKHLALLGDSTIDNGNWTGGGPCVLDQVRALLPQTTLCAKDGALISAIVQQAAEAPAHTTHFVVSVGGNDGLSGVNVMNQRALTVADGMEVVFVFAKEFVRKSTLKLLNTSSNRWAPTNTSCCALSTRGQCWCGYWLMP